MIKKQKVTETQKPKRTKKLTSKEILLLPTKEMIPATIRQGFSTAVHTMILTRVKRRVFFDSRETFYRSMARNIKNNVEFLKDHLNMTEAEFTGQVVAKTSFSHSPRYGANFLIENSYNYVELQDIAFSLGFTFNISLDQLLNSNLEYLFKKDLVAPFEYYACDPEDIKRLLS